MLSLKYLATFVVTLGLIVAAAGPALAVPLGLIRVAGTEGLYWVDDFGIKHFVPDDQICVSYFAGQPVTEISPTAMLSYPKGRALDLVTPPSFFNTRRDLLARAEHIPIGYVRYESVRDPGSPIETRTRIETVYGGPPVRTVEKTIVERVSPARSEFEDIDHVECYRASRVIRISPREQVTVTDGPR